VQPELQSRGLGSELLRRLVATATEQKVDNIGSVFSGNQAVLAFWQRNHFTPVRVGYTREATTGDHSLLVMRGLSSEGTEIAGAARTRFAEDFPLLLLESHRQLAVDLVLTILDSIETRVEYYERDQGDLQRYLSHSTTFENVAPAIWRMLWGRFIKARHWHSADDCGRRLVVMKVLQNHPWEICIDGLGLTGIKQARSLLRQSIAEWTQ
jgi:tRNA(Met) cytidine acetyltransferase